MTALTIYSKMTEMHSAATVLMRSGYFTDVKSQEQAMAKILAGAELGLAPFASMSGIHIVQGKPVLGANLIATLVKSSQRYDYRVKQADNNACVLTWYENGKPVGESSFTMAEATAAGLTNKQTWKAYASDMLFARALTRGARRYAPSIFGGSPIYTPEELGVDTDEDGHIINVTPAPNVAAPVIVQQAQPTTVLNPEDAGDLDEDEREMYKAPAEAFISVASDWLEVDPDAIKQRLMALGYKGIPRQPQSRVDAYRKLKEAFVIVEQPELVTVEATSNGAYAE